jgi:hypothetical protein
MNILTAQGVLQTWEHAQHEHPLLRSQALLHTAWPEVDAAEWGAMPIGIRDAWLFRLQEALFGHELDTLVACPSCQEPLQTRFSTVDLLAHAAGAGTGGAMASLHSDGYELDFRLPCSDDLLAIAETADEPLDVSARRLLERCVLSARHAGEPAAVDALPAAVVDRLQRAMADADPGADTSVALACPACGHRFERRFDIGAYLWDELDDWAQRRLAEVHVLAGAYGWSEPQILALSAARRGHYIALVQS